MRQVRGGSGCAKLGHLRHKLEDNPAQPRYMITETGVGYRFQQA